MPIIKQIIEKERQNSGKIYLYKEGVFYRAYNRSAYLWVTHICGYEVKTRYVKSVGENIFYVGFPMTALEKRLAHHEYKRDGECVEVECGEDDFDDNGYIAWMESLLPGVDGEPLGVSHDDEEASENVIDAIRRFPLESSTPIECVVFLSRLKQQIVM